MDETGLEENEKRGYDHSTVVSTVPKAFWLWSGLVETDASVTWWDAVFVG